MIPKLVERDLLNVLYSMRGLCQKHQSSAGAYPRNYRGGSARLTMVLLVMIPKSVERVLLHVLLSITGFCQKDKGSAGADPRDNKGGSAR